MPDLIYREARIDDVPQMAEVRAGDWGTVEFWKPRITGYLSGEHSPREALAPRTAFVCLDRELIVGLVAGHLTRRFGCDGELQWISVRPRFRKQGIAHELFQELANWFVSHKATRVCVDVEPSNEPARAFYSRQGARDFKPSWMIWDNIG